MKVSAIAAILFATAAIAAPVINAPSATALEPRGDESYGSGKDGYGGSGGKDGYGSEGKGKDRKYGEGMLSFGFYISRGISNQNIMGAGYCIPRRRTRSETKL